MRHVFGSSLPWKHRIWSQCLWKSWFGFENRQLSVAQLKRLRECQGYSGQICLQSWRGFCRYRMFCLSVCPIHLKTNRHLGDHVFLRCGFVNYGLIVQRSDRSYVSVCAMFSAWLHYGYSIPLKRLYRTVFFYSALTMFHFMSFSDNVAIFLTFLLHVTCTAYIPKWREEWSTRFPRLYNVYCFDSHTICLLYNDIKIISVISDIVVVTWCVLRSLPSPRRGWLCRREKRPMGGILIARKSP